MKVTDNIQSSLRKHPLNLRPHKFQVTQSVPKKFTSVVRTVDFMICSLSTAYIFDKNLREVVAKNKIIWQNYSDQLANKDTLEKLRKEKFDIAYAHIYDFCPMIMIEHLKIPTWIWMSSGLLLEPQAYYLGVPTPVSYVPGERIHSH